MRQFFDTLAVFLANVLRLKPASWRRCEKRAQVMRKEHAAFKPAKVFIQGKEEDAVPHASPLAYLGDTLLNALGFVGVVWVVCQVVTAFWLLLPYLLGLAVLALIMIFFAPEKTVQRVS